MPIDIGALERTLAEHKVYDAWSYNFIKDDTAAAEQTGNSTGQ